MSSPVVRPAEQRDIEACIELVLEATGEPSTSTGAWHRGFIADLVEEDRLLLVAELEAEVVGYGRVRTFEPGSDAPLETAPAGYYLVGLFVRSDRRRLGVGFALTETRLRWIARRANEAWFFSNAQNEASIALHRRLGFETVTRRLSFPGVTFDGGEGILFRAVLAESR